MPAKMVARMVVRDAEGDVLNESAHPSFQTAWDQVHRDFFKTWAYMRDNQPARMEALADAFRETYADIRGALTTTTGRVILGEHLVIWNVEEYEPLSTIEPTRWDAVVNGDASMRWANEVTRA